LQRCEVVLIDEIEIEIGRRVVVGGGLLSREWGMQYVKNIIG
jgi:hypothetical protein